MLVEKIEKLWMVIHQKCCVLATRVVSLGFARRVAMGGGTPCGEGGNSPINHYQKGRSTEAGGDATEWWCCHSRRYSDATIHS